jgi:hypothetical protein
VEVAAWAGIWIGITMLVAGLLHLRVKHPFGQALPSFVNFDCCRTGSRALRELIKQKIIIPNWNDRFFVPRRTAK